MKSGGASGLWPVLSILAILLFGVAALDNLARNRQARAITVVVQDVGLDSAGEADPEADDERVQSDLVGAVSEQHVRARELAKRGQLQEALAIFRAELEDQPTSAVLQGELGYWLLVDRQPAAAVSHLRTAYDLDANDTRAALNLSIALRRTEQLPAAEEILRLVLQREPANGQAKVALGTVLRRSGRAGEALAILREAAASGGNEQRAEALAALGGAHLEVGEAEQAAEAFEDAIRWAPANVDVRLAAGRAYLRSKVPGHAERATMILKEATRIAPDVATVHALFGRALEMEGKADGAEAAYRSAIRIDAAYTYARRRLLRLALRRDDVVEARVQADRLLEQEPDEASHHLLAGLTLARQERYEAARKAYQLALALAGDRYPEAWFNLGRLESEAKQLEASATAYQKAIEQRSDYVEAWNNLGLVQLGLERTSEAEQSYRRAIALDDNYASAWFNLARLLDERGDIEGARQALEGAIRVRPDYQAALLNLGALHSRSGDLEAAKNTYEKLLAAKPRYAPGWYNLSVVLGKLKQDRDEYLATQRAVAIDRSHVAALRKLAKLERKRGELETAQELFLEVLDHDPRDFIARLGLAETYRRARQWKDCGRTAAGLMAQRPSSKRARELNDYCGDKRRGRP